MSRSIVITSGKGGVGKSSLSVCIGREMAQRGRKTVLIDTDVGLNNLDVIMDVESRVVFDMGDVVKARCRLTQALVEDSVRPNLHLLPSVKGYSQAVEAESLKKIVGTLCVRYDYVFIDCPAGIGSGFHRAVSCANEAIVVTTPHLSAIKDASTVIKLLSGYPLRRISYVLNRVRGDMVVNSQMADVNDVSSVLEIMPVGVVPENDEINGLSSVGDIISPSGEGGKAIRLLCDNIENGTSEVMDVTRQYRGFWGSLRRLIKTRI